MTRIVPRPQTGVRSGLMAGLLPWRSRAADRAALLDRLPPVEHRPAADEEQLFEQAGLAQVLLLMVKVDQEAEYRLCRELAEHALGSVPDPGEVDESAEVPDLGEEHL